MVTEFDFDCGFLALERRPARSVLDRLFTDARTVERISHELHLLMLDSGAVVSIWMDRSDESRPYLEVIASLLLNWTRKCRVHSNVDLMTIDHPVRIANNTLGHGQLVMLNSGSSDIARVAQIEQRLRYLMTQDGFAQAIDGIAAQRADYSGEATLGASS